MAGHPIMKNHSLHKSLPILLLAVLFLTACNFPLKVLWYTPKPKPTLDPAIFGQQGTPALALQTPGANPLNPVTTLVPYDPNTSVSYLAQSGDTLPVVAARFGVTPDLVTSPESIPAQGIIPTGQQLILPKPQEPSPYTGMLLPDSAVINSPCGRDLDIASAVAQAGGYLNSYTQTVDDITLTGAQVVRRVADNTSTNPHLLLAFIEFRSHWLTQTPAGPNLTYPLSLNTPHYEGLYLELSLAAKMLNTGYYAWRQGQLSELSFAGGGSVKIAPELNAGTVGLQYLFSELYSETNFDFAVYGDGGFMVVYRSLFGDPMICDSRLGPMLTTTVQTPVLELPFTPGETWALTGGLHVDWNTGTPLGALDFAPVTGEARCVVSRAWVLASASGTVTRAGDGVLQLALTDESGQPTGWEILYMHVAEQDRAAVGSSVKTDDRIGHPSCEGGDATGTHVHMARMYLGEWIGAGAPFPLVLSGWTAVPGEKAYQSSLIKGDKVVDSRIDGMYNAQIVR